MFIGHLGTGLAVKKYAPQIPLGIILLASQILDLIFPILLLLGIEHVEIDPENTVVTPLNFSYYPYSHSLFTSFLLALIFSFIYYRFKKEINGAIFLFLLVIGHWLLDFISHRPDLPLFPWGNNYVGLGLWNSLTGTLIFELAIFFTGSYLYFKSTKPINRTGIWSFVIYITLLIILYIGNIFGPPPLSVNAIGFSGLGQLILILLVLIFINRNRIVNNRVKFQTSQLND